MHAQGDHGHEDSSQVHVQEDPPTSNCRGGFTAVVCIVVDAAIVTSEIEATPNLSPKHSGTNAINVLLVEGAQVPRGPCPPCSCVCPSHAARTSPFPSPFYAFESFHWQTMSPKKSLPVNARCSNCCATDRPRPVHHAHDETPNIKKKKTKK